MNLHCRQILTPPNLLIRLLLVLLLCLQAVLVSAQPVAAPAAESLRAQLAGLADRKLPEAEQRALQQLLEQALAQLEAADDSARRMQELQATLRQAPQTIAESRRELDRLRTEPAVPASERLADLGLAELERQFADRSARLIEWQQALVEANSLVINAQSRPGVVQAEISAGQERARRIEAALAAGREDNRPLTPERRDALAAEWKAVDALNRLRQIELAGNARLLELGQARRDVLGLRIARAQQAVRQLQALISERRREASQRAVDTLASDGVEAASGLLAREGAVNRSLSTQLLQATDELNALTQRNLQARQQLDGLVQAERALGEQISVLQGSALLSRILSQQRESLPYVRLDADLTDRIADLRLQQFEIDQRRDRLSSPEAVAEALIAQAPPEQVSAELRQVLPGVLATRGELLERLARELNAVLNEATGLQLTQQKLQATVDGLRETLDEQMFWIPSNAPLDLAWLQALPRDLVEELAAMPWRAGLRELRAGLEDRPFFLPGLLLLVVLLWRRRWLAGRLDRLEQEVGNVHADSQLHTPLAVVITALFALPGTLILALCGLALQADERGQNAAFGVALLQMALAWLVFSTAYRLLARDGVAERHFGWPRDEVAALRPRMRHLGLVAVALAGVVTVAERQPAALADDVVGMLVLLAGYAAMTWLMGRLHAGTPSGERLAPGRLLVNVLLALMPLALLGMLLAGYYYTTVKLTGRLLETLYLLVLWRLLDAMLKRSLAVAARRLAYQRMLAQRDAGGRADAEGNEVTEQPVLDVDKVNQQSLRLMRLGLLTVFAIALYGVWADLITVTSYLDGIVLYEFAGAAGAEPISLYDALGALLIVAVAFVLAGNLPGLLEVAVLSRLQLAQGSAYAITTLLSYVIGAVGFVAMLGTLGVSWDKLQWLAAALSVGLGFGLQEIFANFVSGLMILFERPMRIGDTVTVGNLSGTVSRIQIRATTIVDFDRKEIIVPNKTFVTSQLINWSLSDTVTRVTIKLGVAYGSDLALVKRLLLQIATDNPRVLTDPPPRVFFVNFGASTLDHEMMVHVRELSDRYPAIDEINREIDATFAAHGIEIAFARMDVHVRRIDGAEALLQRLGARPADGDAAAAAG